MHAAVVEFVVVPHACAVAVLHAYSSGVIACMEQRWCPMKQLGYLAVANRWVAASIGSQDAAQSRAASAIHDWVARKGAVQVFLYLQIPVMTGGVPTNCYLAAQIA